MVCTREDFLETFREFEKGIPAGQVYLDAIKVFVEIMRSCGLEEPVEVSATFASPGALSVGR